MNCYKYRSLLLFLCFANFYLFICKDTFKCQNEFSINYKTLFYQKIQLSLILMIPYKSVWGTRTYLEVVEQDAGKNEFDNQ